MEKYRTAGETTDENVIRRTRMACWITKATNTRTLTECVINLLIVFPLQQWFLRTHLIVALYIQLLVLLRKFISFTFTRCIIDGYLFFVVSEGLFVDQNNSQLLKNGPTPCIC